MTVTVKAFCRSPGCRVLVDRGFCPAHRKAERAERGATDADKFYGTARWKRLREYHRTREPFCRMCLKEEGRYVLGTLVDHVLPIEEGGEAMDDSNLQTLCDRHHAQKRQRERK